MKVILVSGESDPKATMELGDRGFGVAHFQTYEGPNVFKANTVLQDGIEYVLLKDGMKPVSELTSIEKRILGL